MRYQAKYIFTYKWVWAELNKTVHSVCTPLYSVHMPSCFYSKVQLPGASLASVEDALILFCKFKRTDAAQKKHSC